MERARRPVVPKNCDHSGHIYYLLLQKSRAGRDKLIRSPTEGILAPFHYVPLHSAPAGRRYGGSAVRSIGPIGRAIALSDCRCLSNLGKTRTL
jgi:hypothetical protein